MKDDQRHGTANRLVATRSRRAAFIVAGVLLPQAWLFGPSLMGQKILLPLDLLANPNTYLPRTPENLAISARATLPVASDLVLNQEPFRRFVAAELRAGRLPLWDPYSYAGTPCVWGYLSPFEWIYFAWPSPRALPWMHLAQSLVAALGAYFFFRRVMAVGFWPAAVGAWCYPLTGFFIVWTGFRLGEAAAWLPVVLLATDAICRRPFGWGGPALSVLTTLTVVSGAVDVAGQVLLTSGLYGLWRLFVDVTNLATARHVAGPLAVLTLAWGLGFALAAPHLLPLAGYVRSGARMADRAQGVAERPPVGVAALPQIVLPNFHGTHQPDSWYLIDGNQLESAVGAYTGLLATLVLAPLAWCRIGRRRQDLFWVALGLMGLSWLLNVPGLVAIWRLPGLNMLSHNRFAFATAFAILSLAVVGLEQLWQAQPGRQWWFLAPALFSAALGGWCLYRAAHLPEPVATELGRAVKAGQDVPRVPDQASVGRIRRTFVQTSLEGAAWCGVACACWLLVGSRQGPPVWFRIVLASLLLCELLRFADGFSPQCNPKLYYPPIPVLERLTEAPPGRVLGVGCLPSMLNEIYRLRDVRGYDSVDPHRIVELLRAVEHPNLRSPDYARLQTYVPRFRITRDDGKIRAPGIIDMLAVRYFIFRGTASPHAAPLVQQDDYWVVENQRALPRAFVPRRLATVADERSALELMAADEFDPRRVAYVAEPLDVSNDCRGTAVIVNEVPCLVTLVADMRTAGLLVLADQWYEGWHANVDGRDVPILRVNHALRGVVVPSGKSTVQFRYEPPGFAFGLWLALGAAVLLTVWIVLLFLRRTPDVIGGQGPDHE